MTGAFSSVTADRTVSVAVAEDDAAYLSLEPSTGPNGVYAEQSDGTLQLNFDGTNTLADGLNPDATTYAANVFVVTNRGSAPVSVSVDDTVDGLSLFAGQGETERRLDGTDADGVTIGVGESANVSVEIDSSNETELESLEAITINAVATDTDGSPGDGSDDSEDPGDGSGENGDSGDGSDGDQDDDTPTDGTDGSDNDTVDSGTDGDVAQATGSVAAGESVTLNLTGLDSATQDDVSVRSTTISYADSVENINTTVSVVDSSESTATAPGDRPAPPDASVRTYVNVSHPATPDAAIAEASFLFTVPHDSDRPAQNVSFLRYNETTGGWETISTRVTFVENTSAGYVYRSQTEQLSLFALVEAARGVYVQTEGTTEAVDASLITDPRVDFPATAYNTYHTQALNASYWKVDAREDADDAAAVIREELRVNLKSEVEDAAIDQAISYADGALKSATGFSGIGTALTAIDIALKSDQFAGSLGPGIQKQAIAIHVDPGTDSYDNLRENLAKLERNSIAYKQAKQRGNAAEVEQLLRERETLLQETYLLLPTYLQDVHADVVSNAAGIEDPQAYQQIRSDVESLRLLVKLDYEETTDRLYGAPDESLPRDTSMPTHGWTAFGNAQVYDTMDHADDYVVFELDAAPNGTTADELNIDVTGANAAAFETALVTERPDTPRLTTGRELSVADTETLSASIEDPAATTYLVVRAGDSLGPLKLSASGTGGTVDVAVAERAGPDIQRPDATLVEGPDPVTLRDGDAVYPTDNGDIDLIWDVWDAKTATTDIEYRFRVDDGEGFTGGEAGDGWSAWTTLPENGRISPEQTYGDGLTRVQLQVRDGVGRTTVRNADVVVTAGAPTTRVAAPLADDPTTDDVYVKVLPERRIESVEVEYRQVGDANWTDWRRVTGDDLDGFGRLQVPIEGEIEVRARATNLTNETGPWASETVRYFPPDTTPPDIDAESLPLKRPTLVDGERVERRVVAAQTVSLAWSADDAETSPSDLEYRVQVDGKAWSEWTPTENGRLSVDVDVATDGTDVTVNVRDAAGNIATRSVSVRRDNHAPIVNVSATADETGAIVTPTADEPLSSVQLQYRTDDDAAWTDWTTLDSSETTAVQLDAVGAFELRARGVDSVGNVGEWTGPVPFNSLPGDRSEPLGGGGNGDDDEDDDGNSLSGGSNQSYTVPDGSDVGDAIVAYNALVDEIDGELLLDLYVSTRDGDRYPLSSITFTEERNQTVTADLPGNLTDDSQLEVEVRGNGTVVLDSLRLIDRTPYVPPIAGTPTNATTGEKVTIAPSNNRAPSEAVVKYEWDIDGDGAYEQTTTNATLTTTYTEPGSRTVTLRLTDAFGASATNQTTVSINAPPQAAISSTGPALTDEPIRLSGGASVDPDGTIATYDWTVPNSGTRTTDGSNATVRFPDDGTYMVTLTTTDGVGATDTVSTNVTVTNRPPVVDATTNESTPAVNAPVVFKAGNSVDPDGNIERYEWDLDGDSTYERSGRTIETTFDTPGEQPVTVRATDDDGGTNETTVTVDVNAPPTASLETTAPAFTGDNVTFTAADSTDPDGDIIAYDWSIADAADASNVSVTRTFADDGNYSVTLRVTDNQGAVDTATTTVAITNRPPIPNGVVTTATPVVGDPVAFSAADSTDADGEVVETRWDLDANGHVESNASEPTATYDDYGEQTATLTVIDDDGARNKTTLTFDVNAPPTPAFTTSAPVPTAESIDLVADSSVDPDGTIESYEWDLDTDGTSEATGSTTSVEFADDGTYSIELTVTDNDGTDRSLTRNVTVTNRPPNATATANDTTPAIGQPVTFDASESTDVDGAIATVAWDITNDGTYDFTGEQVTRAFSEPGNQSVTVRVTDDDGATARTNVTVDVNRPPNPRVNVSDPVLSNEPVTLTGSQSNDPDGTVVAYEWTIEAAPDAAGANVNRTFTDDGSYAVTLTATDDDGATASVTTNVTVQNRPPELWLTRVSPETTPVETGDEVEYAIDASDDDGAIDNTTLTVTSSTGVTRTVTPAGTATVRFNESGNWSVTAAVTDDDGATTATNRTLRVNAPPDVTIVAPDSVDANEDVTVEADATDPDSEISEYSWEVEGRTYSGPNVTFNADGGEVIPVSLQVTDTAGATTVVNETIAVNPGLDPRVYVRTQLGNRVLSSEASVDTPDSIDREAVTYEWDLDGDGQFESDGRAQNRLITEPGEYEVAVRVNAPNASPAVDRESIPIVSVDESLTFDWQRDSGGEIGARAGESLYVLDGEEQSDDENESDSTVRSLDPADGSTQWAVTTPFYAGDTHVQGDAVYAVGQGVARITQDSGVIDWSWTTAEYVEAQITEDTVYVADDQSIAALNKTTGAVRWDVDADNSSNPSTLVAGSDTVATERIVSTETGSVSNIVVRDATTGAVRWQLTRDDYPEVEGIVDGRLILSESGTITAYNVNTGAVAWSQQPAGNQSSYSYVRSVQIDNGTIFATSDAGTTEWVTAIEPTGEQNWRTAARDSAELQVADDHVILAGEGGVSARDRTDGSVAWDQTLPAEFPDLTIADDAALVEYDYGERGAILDTETGAIEWQSRTNYVFYDVAYEDGTLYVSTEAGLYAVSDSDENNVTARHTGALG
ncbi:MULTISPECIES: PKD domain-containing protein [unclassified Halorubrum]|uniref:PKD domain-containing protein n=1 Tax=unclassified Halorubrum TaxID=2642239 RepID=UPI001314EF41|nr:MULTISPECIES: PKD domain-containing protein [unclassified Halorubrum]